MEAIDISGKVLKVGDTIVFGHDNGSTLVLGKIYKITPKKVWYKYVGNDYVWEGCRDHQRVCKVD